MESAKIQGRTNCRAMLFDAAPSKIDYLCRPFFEN
jgi:hypothetical protein